MDSFISEEGLRSFIESEPIDLELYFDEEGEQVQKESWCDTLTKCSSCGLHGYGPVQPVFNPKARFALIGRGPTRNDILNNTFLPSTGSFYPILLRYLELLGVELKDLYLTNSTFCRPLDFRTPVEAELLSCSRFKYHELFTFMPDLKMVFLMGETPLRQFIGNDASTILWCNTFKLTRQKSIILIPIFDFGFYLSHSIDREGIEKHLLAIKKKFINGLGEIR